MDIRQSWGRGRMYSTNHLIMTSRLQTTPTTTRNHRHQKKTAVLLCCCSEQQCNYHSQSGGQQYACACCRNCLLAPPPRTAVYLCCCSSYAVGILYRQARHSFIGVYSGPKGCGTAAGCPPQPLQSTAVVLMVAV